MRTKNDALDILRRVTLACDRIFEPGIKDAYLYGSYARGDNGPESDIDILLTTDLSGEAIAQRRSAVADITSDLSLEYDVTVSVTVKPLAQFIQYKEAMPFYTNVVKEGIRYAG